MSTVVKQRKQNDLILNVMLNGRPSHSSSRTAITEQELVGSIPVIDGVVRR